MFGDFDGPKRGPAATTPPKPRLSSPTAVATGELSSDLFAAFDASPPTTASPPGGHDRTPGCSGSQAGLGSPAGGERGAAAGLGRTSPRSSSYGFFEGEEPSWEEYDRHVARQPGDEESDSSAKGGGEQDTPLEVAPSSGGARPQQWDVWAEDLAYEAATKRLLRELRHLLGGLDALAPTAPNMAFALESLGAEGTGTGSNGGAAGADTGKPPPALLESVRAV
ncbi:unnamed protein product, partial [Ectocarpus sp. 12 AP-2014]